jgi:aminoglycoside phosphotransferase (APT) family kinase protein
MRSSSVDQAHIEIDSALVRRLVADQFPEWADLTVEPVAQSGWDNRMFHLGDHLVVRLPSANAYAPQVEKEHRWLPILAPSLPLEIPAPVRFGTPTSDFPRHWSVYRWIDGESAAASRIFDEREFATQLAHFLNALERIAATGAPPPGPHNFYRGGSLSTYDAEARNAIIALKGRIDTVTATTLWDHALATSWTKPPVWIHGDVSAGNLLLREGRLSSVIDFGMMGIGDPACDLTIAWTLFSEASRASFRAALPHDANTWARGRAWTLWKAVIVAAGHSKTNAVEAARPFRVIEEVLEDHKLEERR